MIRRKEREAWSRIFDVVLRLSRVPLYPLQVVGGWLDGEPFVDHRLALLVAWLLVVAVLVGGVA